MKSKPRMHDFFAARSKCEPARFGARTVPVRSTVDGRGLWNTASRSEAMMVAAGFNPRMTIDRMDWRRVATHDAVERTLVFNRRSATAGRTSPVNPWVKTHGYLQFVAPRRGLHTRPSL